ncbi:hypothetical protein C1H46_025538 [Malus baccata]|uniref:Uncharacterized protein n=1 Tax=Malus baccata TaxID=106549 RepID=A0A540LR32_MALBA|nr:hypothetical protein C1H46_025538 [Malus baccata]
MCGFARVDVANDRTEMLDSPSAKELDNPCLRNPIHTISRVLISYIRGSSTSEGLCQLSPPPPRPPLLAVDLDQPLLVVLAAVVAEVEVGFLQVLSSVGDDGGGGVGGWWWWW